MDRMLDVLIWIALIFLAGVISQFGKSLTLKLLAAARQEPRQIEAASEPGGEELAGALAAKDKKKLAKLEYKRRKKENKAAIKRSKEDA